MNRKSLFMTVLFLSFLYQANANEKIHSWIDNYYDALSLNGSVERPYLHFKSFSVNQWDDTDSDLPWSDNVSSSKPLWNKGRSSLFLENPSWFQSFNLNTPHGINDGGLWQGRGYNTAISGGFTFKSPWLDVMLYPELYFSQNLEYNLQTPSSWSGSEFGYPYSGIDNPQRFGDESFWYGSWGQSQIRLKYNNWSLGFGTENIWIGPGTQSAPMLSNNADGFPHIDVGMNRTSTSIGDMEFRMWWGWLKSSEYYERAEANAYLDYLGGVSFSYSPFFIPGLTLGVHKTTQVDLDDFTAYHVIAPIDPGIIKKFNGGVDLGTDGADGRASITWNWLFSTVGFEFYGEWVMEDYTPSIDHLLRRPNHASGFTLGAKQNLRIGDYKDRFFVFNAEFSSLVWSRDYYLNGLGWGGGFYRHYETNLGYANSGQCLGSGYGSGGDLQHFEVDYYAPFGMAGLYLTRIKFDDTAMYSEENIADRNPDWDVPVQLAVGGKGYYFLPKGFAVGATLAYIYDMNWKLDASQDYMGMYANLTFEYRY